MPFWRRTQSDPWLIFSYGMTKCATTYAFQMMKAAFEAEGWVQPRLPDAALGPGRGGRRLNAVGHLTRTEVARLRTAARTLGHPVLVKTHTRPDPQVVRLIERGEALGHALVRDPRDMALSMCDHGARARAEGNTAFAEIRTLADAEAGIRNQMDSLSAWLQMPGIQPVRYDDVAFAPAKTLARLIAPFGLSVDTGAIAADVRARHFIQFNKGQRDRHLTEMDAATSARFRAVFAPFYAHVLEAEPKRDPVLPPRTQLWCAVDNPTRVTTVAG